MIQKKLNNLLRILAQHRVVKVAQIRKENGQFSHFDIQVDDGSSFTVNTLDEIAQRGGNFDRPAENGGAVKQSYKEHINKDDIIKEKDKSICATDVAQDRFKEFWSVYPRKKDKNRAENIWRKEKLDNKADEIIKDVNNRLLNEQSWKDPQFIPHPTTYLKFERWNDEVTLKTISSSSSKFNPTEYALNKIKQRQQGKLS